MDTIDKDILLDFLIMETVMSLIFQQIDSIILQEKV